MTHSTCTSKGTEVRGLSTNFPLVFDTQTALQMIVIQREFRGQPSYLGAYNVALVELAL